MQQGLAAHEYRPSKNIQGLQAPNRAHNLRTYFDGSGIRVYDRTAAEAPQLVGLSLIGLGRGDAVAPVSAGTMGDTTARVEIVRPGVIEWYENSPAGLEQRGEVGTGADLGDLQLDRADPGVPGPRAAWRSSERAELQRAKTFRPRPTVGT